MNNIRLQRTLAKTTTISGKGYWSGLLAELVLHPAPANSGISFVRVDIPEQPRISACVGNRTDTPLRTALAQGTASVEMVEHVMAALYGLHVDNCVIEINRAELPALDGSSLAAVEAIERVGTVEQELPRTQLVVREAIQVGDEKSWVRAEPSSTGRFHLTYHLDYPTCPAIGKQSLSLEITPKSFRDELCSARTFLLESEAEWLRQQGLGRHVSFQDLLVFSNSGPIENQLRFQNECVRHKMLDAVGDLALAGCDLIGNFTAYRSGHKLNADMVRQLLRTAEWVEPQRKSA